VHDVGLACPFALEDGGEVAERLAGLFEGPAAVPGKERGRRQLGLVEAPIVMER
jgi:hypothetical protein